MVLLLILYPFPGPFSCLFVFPETELETVIDIVKVITSKAVKSMMVLRDGCEAITRGTHY